MKKLSWLWAACLAVAFSMGLLFSRPAQPAEAVQMPPTPMVDRLAPPPTVYPPTQADTGAQEYYQRCMACHGDRGQGLTQEWLDVLNVDDRNCWQSGCHNPRHPPDGFVFPKEVPRVAGEGALAGFATAQDLYNFLVAKMPYQTPGTLSETQYWELTAFLLRLNGVKTGVQTLNAQNAASVHLNEPALPPTGFAWQTWLPYLVAAVLALAVLGALIWKSR